MLSSLVVIQLLFATGFHGTPDPTINFSKPTILENDNSTWGEGWPFINWFVSDGAFFVEPIGLFGNVTFWACCAAGTFCVLNRTGSNSASIQFTIVNFAAAVVVICVFLSLPQFLAMFDRFIVVNVGLMRRTGMPDPITGIFALVGSGCAGFIAANWVLTTLLGNSSPGTKTETR